MTSESVSLYYTGLIDKATVTDSKGNKKDISLQRDYSALIDVDVPAEGMSWYLIETP